MLPLRVLAVADPSHPRLTDAVDMVALALDANRPDCALPLRIRVHNGPGEARTSVVNEELWIDVGVPANADPLPMVVLEAVWDGLRLAQSQHREARITYPVSRARSLLLAIEQRMESTERAHDLNARALRDAMHRQLQAGNPDHALIVRLPVAAPPRTPSATAVFEMMGPGMPAFRVTRRRRR